MGIAEAEAAAAAEAEAEAIAAAYAACAANWAAGSACFNPSDGSFIESLAAMGCEAARPCAPFATQLLAEAEAAAAAEAEAIAAAYAACAAGWAEASACFNPDGSFIESLAAMGCEAARPCAPF